MSTNLDPGQVLKGAYDDSSQALQVKNIAGSLITVAFDSIALTYSGSNISTVRYYTGGLSGTLVGTLTLTYSGSNLIGVVRS